VSCGAYIKIGYFGNGDEVLFQDEVHGNLFEQIEGVMDFLFTKYTKALISYEGIHRVEAPVHITRYSE
jgi:ATP-dependent DNA helicase RecG